ncbi:MAG: hypothetical protein QM519_03745, partial [Bacteroidia bacterium]|nr:hypothetical protein [Bacteroidia bacterium]
MRDSIRSCRAEAQERRGPRSGGFRDIRKRRVANDSETEGAPEGTLRVRKQLSGGRAGAERRSHPGSGAGDRIGIDAGLP